MNSAHLFTQALGLLPPWYVEKIEFSKVLKGRKRLDIYLRFKRGSKFKDEKVLIALFMTLLNVAGNT